MGKRNQVQKALQQSKKLKMTLQDIEKDLHKKKKDKKQKKKKDSSEEDGKSSSLEESSSLESSVSGSESESHSDSLSEEEDKLKKMLSKRSLNKIKELGDKVALAKGTKKALKTLE
jgi:hypothetical protein